ncbi:MAG: hypothetical protein AAFU66_10750, partial [Pseudomonadota bacterium]
RERAGLSASQLSLMATGDKDRNLVSRLKSQGNLPRMDTLQALALALGVSTDYLCCMPNSDVTISHRDTGRVFTKASALTAADFSNLYGDPVSVRDRPSIDAVLRWWRNNKRVLQRSNQILDYCDIYLKPTEDEMRMRPIELGSKSLAATEFRLTDAKDLERELEIIPNEATDTVVSWHFRTSESSPMLSEEHLQCVTAKGVTVSITYFRLLLAVIGPDGEDNLILCYAQPIDRDLNRTASTA